MGLKALITLDLPGAGDEARHRFYEVLEKAHWMKLPELSTSWVSSFHDPVSWDVADRTIKATLTQAQTEARIRRLVYAFQMSTEMPVFKIQD